VSSVGCVGTVTSGVLPMGAGLGVLPAIGGGVADDVLGDQMAALNALMAQSIAAAAADPAELLCSVEEGDDTISSSTDVGAVGSAAVGPVLAPKLSFWGSVKKLASQASVKKLTGQTSVKPPKATAAASAKEGLVSAGSIRKGFAGLHSQGSVRKLVSWGSGVQGKPSPAPVAVAVGETKPRSSSSSSGRSCSSSSSRGMLKPAASVVSAGAWAQKPLGPGVTSVTSASTGRSARLATAKSVSFGGTSSSSSMSSSRSHGNEEGEGEGIVVGLPELRQLRLKHCQLQKVSLMDVISNPRVSV
jgi:hypothetical protein